MSTSPSGVWNRKCRPFTATFEKNVFACPFLVTRKL